MTRLLREPLLHFILAGAILFAVYAHFDSEPAPDELTVVVDRRALLTFLQYRANAFDPEAFGAALDAMSASELDELIQAYVDEEILYREARALGLDDSDNIIRQRMVQKMTFLMTDLATVDAPSNQQEIEAYFQANIDAYAIQPWTTFTHVFFDADKRGPEGARAAAEQARIELNTTGAVFSDAPQYGDGFPFLRNYVERTFEYVASHFGYEFVNAIAAIAPSPTEWQGPFRSAYGEHVLLMTDKVERMLPVLGDVQSVVEQDLATERSQQAIRELTQTLRDRYTVDLQGIRE